MNIRSRTEVDNFLYLTMRNIFKVNIFKENIFKVKSLAQLNVWG